MSGLCFNNKDKGWPMPPEPPHTVTFKPFYKYIQHTSINNLIY